MQRCRGNRGVEGIEESEVQRDYRSRGAEERDTRASLFVSDSCDFVDKAFRVGFVTFRGRSIHGNASVLQEKCRICDIFLLNNRPKLAENVEKQAEFSNKNRRINRQI